MNETTRRFLSAVLDRIPEQHIVELRLFPTISQGGMESGVAVLAVAPEALAPPAVLADNIGLPETIAHDEAMVDLDSLMPRGSGPTAVDAAFGAADEQAIDQGHTATRLISVSKHELAQADGSANAAPASAERATDVEVAIEGVSLARRASQATDSSLRGSDVVVGITAATDDDAPERLESVTLGDILALPAPDPNPLVGAKRPPQRVAIVSARYKLTVKGPDRGKWDFDVVHEADAPLETLDRVVKGVVKRSGEMADPELFSAASLREALDQPVWATSSGVAR